MSRDYSHFTSVSGLENTSLDLNDAEKGFDNIMAALDQTASSLYGVWDGAGADTSQTDNKEFRRQYDEVQNAFQALIKSNDDVTERTRAMHARLGTLFEK